MLYFDNSKIGNVFCLETQKSVFTVFAKYNIDLNSRSSNVTMDYYGTSFSLIQMHSEISEGTVYDYTYTMDNAIDWLKIDSLPEEFLQISTFLTDLGHAPKCKDALDIPSVDSSILNEAVPLEIKWLDTSIGHHFMPLTNNIRSIARTLLLCYFFYVKNTYVKHTVS